MDDEMRAELECLVVAYMTSGLKENPNGISLQYFISSFPEKSDEPADWYKKFNMRDPLSALKAIPNAVRLSSRGNQTFVSLNLNSDKVDHHMVDLVTNQRAKTGSKRKKPAYSNYRSAAQRAMDSFGLNRRYNVKSDFVMENRFSSRFQQRTPSSNGYSNSSRSAVPKPPSRPTVYSDTQVKAPGDPRARNSATSMVPPQVRPMSATAQSMATPSKQTPPPPSNLSSTSSIRPISSRLYGSSAVPSSAHKAYPSEKPRPVSSDPDVDSKLKLLCQNLVDLLTNKFDTLKLFHLASVYKEEFKEDLDPAKFGHKTVTELLKTPPLCECIKVVPGHPYNLVKVINASERNGKENISSRVSNVGPTNGLSKEPLKDRSNMLSASKAKFDAINPFNVRTMLQSLEPLNEVKAPALGRARVEDTVKYRTMRLINKSPNMTLKLEEWERKYQIDWGCNMRVPIQDYGFKTLLEFFKELAKEIPIKISLQNDEWVAKSDIESVSKWLNKTMLNGNYRAVMVMDKRYDSAAMPTDNFVSFDLKSLKQQEYYPVTIMSVKSPCKMWLQIKTQEQITAHLSIESSLTSYEDYRRKGILQVPQEFIRMGFPCAAFDDAQQRWCRASIVKVSSKEDTVTAFLVDYGITRTIKKSQLLCILKSHLAQPVGIIYAQLTNVLPTAERFAKVILQELTSPPVQLACKIHEHYPAKDDDLDWQVKRYIHDVTLVDTRHGTDRNLATTINCSSQISPDDLD